jgi:TRAP-type mannitol/chloroaromatic compound transport system permease small subunit
MRRMAGPLLVPMNAERLLHAIDQLSYWSGKAFAWLIVLLTLVVFVLVLFS